MSQQAHRWTVEVNRYEISQHEIYVHELPAVSIRPGLLRSPTEGRNVKLCDSREEELLQKISEGQNDLIKGNEDFRNILETHTTHLRINEDAIR